MGSRFRDLCGESPLSAWRSGAAGQRCGSSLSKWSNGLAVRVAERDERTWRLIRVTVFVLGREARKPGPPARLTWMVSPRYACRAARFETYCVRGASNRTQRNGIDGQRCSAGLLDTGVPTWTRNVLEMD